MTLSILPVRSSIFCASFHSDPPNKRPLYPILGIESSLIVIPADQCAMARETFKRESDSQFIEAKREQEREVFAAHSALNCKRLYSEPISLRLPLE